MQPVVGRIAFPKMLSFLGFSDFNAFVPGIRDIIEGGYELPDGETALSFEEKRARGRLAIQALADYRTAVEAGDDEAAALYKEELRRNYAYFGYGYLETPEDLIPPGGLTFYSFRIMVILGMWFILLFLVAGFFVWKRDVARQRWLLWVALLTIPLGYLAGEFGWVVAEVGRQPWAIQDILPVQAAISSISAESVRLTFFIFLVLFTALFVAEVTSVVVQILAFRTTGRRVFRMAPFHHHFELAGWAETTVIIRFWLLTAIACGLGVALFYSEWLSAGGR